MRKTIISIVVISLFLGQESWAAEPNFTDISQSDFEKISKELSANFMHHSVTGAAGLGKVFGAEVALVGGMTPSPETNDIVKRSTSDSSELPNLYHAGLLAAVTVPFGISGELVYVPTLKSSDAEFSSTSLGLKFNLSDSLLSMIPCNIAVRGIYSSSKFSFKQTISGVESTVENKSTVTGVQFLFSPRLPVVEPYLGVGFLKANDTLGVSGTGTIFDTDFTTSQSAETDLSSSQYFAGVNLQLLLISLGAEYSRQFDTNRYSFKLGLVF